MPAKSRAQFRFMQGVAHGDIQAKSLNRVKAAEYVSGQSPKGLPERKKKRAKLSQSRMNKQDEVEP